MSRRLKQQFNCQPLSELVRQLVVAPPAKRIEQVRGAETLHDEIDPQRNYPFEFVKFRITGHRIASEDIVLVGEALLPDLRLLIDSLSGSVGMPRDDSEPALTPQELADKLNVSTKTIGRWRKIALRWRWAQPVRVGGRKQLVITDKAVERFLQVHGDRIERAGRFTPLDEQARRDLIDQARQLARQPAMSIHRAARHLAQQTGRGVETVRRLLDQHDRKHADDRIFVNHTGPLSPRHKRLIARAHRMGVAVNKLAVHFRRSVPTIRRVIRDQRAAALRCVRIEYVPAPTFDREDADHVLLRPEPAPPPAGRAPAGLAAALADLPQELVRLYDQPTLQTQHQQSLIVRMNYLKCKAARLRHELDQYDPRAAQLDLIEQWLGQARSIHDRLVAANLPHVLVVARQHLGGRGAEPIARLVDLLQIGNDAMIGAVEQYDAAQGEAFEPFLTWTLRRRYARVEPDTTKAHRRLTGAAMLEQLRRAAASADAVLPM